MLSNTTGKPPSLQHGIYSPATIDPIAHQIAVNVLQRRPDLQRYPEAIESWANLEAKCQLLRQWVTEHSMFGSGYRPRAGVGLLLRFEEAARRARKELGLSPLAEIELEKLKREFIQVDNSLDDLRNRGKAARGTA